MSTKKNSHVTTQNSSPRIESGPLYGQFVLLRQAKNKFSTGKKNAYNILVYIHAGKLMRTCYTQLGGTVLAAQEVRPQNCMQRTPTCRTRVDFRLGP